MWRENKSKLYSFFFLSFIPRTQAEEEEEEEEEHARVDRYPGGYSSTVQYVAYKGRRKLINLLRWFAHCFFSL